MSRTGKSALDFKRPLKGSVLLPPASSGSTYRALSAEQVKTLVGKKSQDAVLDLSGGQFALEGDEWLVMAPDAIGEIDLSHNSLTRLTQIRHLTKLRYLVADNNAISEVNLTGLTRLEVLSLARNRLKEVPLLANMAKLHAIDLSGNALTRGFNHFDGLISLKVLDLRNCELDLQAADLTALLLRPLSLLPKLRHLFLAGNPFLNNVEKAELFVINHLTDLKSLDNKPVSKEERTAAAAELSKGTWSAAMLRRASTLSPAPVKGNGNGKIPDRLNRKNHRPNTKDSPNISERSGSGRNSEVGADEPRSAMSAINLDLFLEDLSSALDEDLANAEANSSAFSPRTEKILQEMQDGSTAAEIDDFLESLSLPLPSIEPSNASEKLLLRVLNTPDELARFADFVSAQHCAEGLHFWQESTAFRATTSPSKARAREIYNKYLSEDADEPVNVEAHIGAEVCEGLDAETPLRTLFDNAIKANLKVLCYDPFARFQDTAEGSAVCNGTFTKSQSAKLAAKSAPSIAPNEKIRKQLDTSEPTVIEGGKKEDKEKKDSRRSMQLSWPMPKSLRASNKSDKSDELVKGEKSEREKKKGESEQAAEVVAPSPLVPLRNEFLRPRSLSNVGVDLSLPKLRITPNSAVQHSIFTSLSAGTLHSPSGPVHCAVMRLPEGSSPSVEFLTKLQILPPPLIRPLALAAPYLAVASPLLLPTLDINTAPPLLNLLRAVIAALTTLHSMGIAHGFICPLGIHVDNQSSHVDPPWHLLGIHAPLPENFADPMGDVSIASDIFSFGALIKALRPPTLLARLAENCMSPAPPQRPDLAAIGRILGLPDETILAADPVQQPPPAPDEPEAPAQPPTSRSETNPLLGAPSSRLPVPSVSLLTPPPHPELAQVFSVLDRISDIIHTESLPRQMAALQTLASLVDKRDDRLQLVAQHSGVLKALAYPLTLAGTVGKYAFVELTLHTLINLARASAVCEALANEPAMLAALVGLVNCEEASSMTLCVSFVIKLPPAPLRSALLEPVCATIVSPSPFVVAAVLPLLAHLLHDSTATQDSAVALGVLPVLQTLAQTSASSALGAFEVLATLRSNPKLVSPPSLTPLIGALPVAAAFRALIRLASSSALNENEMNALTQAALRSFPQAEAIHALTAVSKNEACLAMINSAELAVEAALGSAVDDAITAALLALTSRISLLFDPFELLMRFLKHPSPSVRVAGLSSASALATEVNSEQLIAASLATLGQSDQADLALLSFLGVALPKLDPSSPVLGFLVPRVLAFLFHPNESHAAYALRVAILLSKLALSIVIKCDPTHSAVRSASNHASSKVRTVAQKLLQHLEKSS